MREFVIRRLRRAPIIRDLWDEYERMVAERDLAISDRIASLEARNRAIAAQVIMEKKIEELLSNKPETLQVVSDNEKPFLRKIQHVLDFNPHINEWEVLRGTQYSRYLLPLEYLPSRDYNPRWGIKKPPIKQISELFEQYVGNYRQVLKDMRRLAPNLADVPLFWDPTSQPQPCWAHTPLNSFDALLIYTMLAMHKPSIYLEVGSGISTLFAYRAKKDLRLETQIWSIDPDPRSEVDAACDIVRREPFESTDLDIFLKLRPGDVVFFDGTHRAFGNSDVTVFMIDVLPILVPGVIIHFHDIYLPMDYFGFAVDWYWNEQYLLAAYIMAAPERIRHLMPASFISQRPELFPEHFADQNLLELGEWGSWYGGGSFWFTKVNASDAHRRRDNAGFSSCQSERAAKMSEDPSYPQ